MTSLHNNSHVVELKLCCVMYDYSMVKGFGQAKLLTGFIPWQSRGVIKVKLWHRGPFLKAHVTLCARIFHGNQHWKYYVTMAVM